MDTASARPRERWRNLKRNIRREGTSYPFYRAVSALKEKLDDWADRVIPQGEVDQLLDRAFPARNLSRLAQQYQFPIFETGNLNGPEAVERLRALAPVAAGTLG